MTLRGNPSVGTHGPQGAGDDGAAQISLGAALPMSVCAIGGPVQLIDRVTSQPNPSTWTAGDRAARDRRFQERSRAVVYPLRPPQQRPAWSLIASWCRLR
jgi:hypothetical protein